MSTFTTVQAQFLRRLVKERPEQRRAGGAATHFCHHFSVGSLVGQAVLYSESHFRMAENILRAHDLPLVEPDADAGRADIAVFGGMSEKELSQGPHADSVAVRFVGACSLGGAPVTTPPGAYLVLPVATALQIRCDRLMVVENLETFRQLERYEWINFEGRSVMAIFRGDPRLSTRDALDVIVGAKLPIWAFVDFDPAGLAIACALPADRLERLILPSLEWLTQAADSARGRLLYADQVGGCSNVLEAAGHPEVALAWSTMRTLRSAVTQERMLNAPRF